MWDSLNWERTNRKTSANGRFLNQMNFFFKGKKYVPSILVKLKCWKSKITCQGWKCCHWQSPIPQIPRPNESFKRLARGAKSRLLPKKRISYQNRLQAQNKERGDLLYIPPFLLLNSDHSDEWDNRHVRAGFVLPFPTSEYFTSQWDEDVPTHTVFHVCVAHVTSLKDNKSS